PAQRVALARVESLRLRGPRPARRRVDPHRLLPPPAGRVRRDLLRRRPAVRRALLLLLATLVALAAASPAGAQVVRGFTPRFTTNVPGDVALIGNTIMSCSGGGGCTNARNAQGGNVDDNDFDMQYVDIDADGTTFSSSRATLALPTGATVLWAGLYWGGSSNAAARNQVRLSTPVAGYVTLTATQLDATGSIYQGFVDVTALVLAGGTGQHKGANAPST